MQDLVITILVVFILGIMAIIGYHVLNSFYTSPIVAEKGIDTSYFSKGMEALTVFDGAMVFFLMGMVMITLVLAFMINTHPAFFFISFIIVTFMAGVAAMITNTFFDFISNATIAAAAEKFPMTIFIMQNYPKIYVVVAALTMIVMYAQYRRTQEYGYGGF